MIEKILEELKKNNCGHILKNIPLRNYTTMGIGGPADILIEPENISQIKDIVKLADLYSIPLTIIGNGSNLLVRDKGVRGIVLAIKDKYSDIKISGNMIIAESGALLRDVSKKSFESGLTGMEPLSGIPGSVGGAIIMNAGAYGTEIKDVVSKVLCLDKKGNLVEYTNNEMEFSYRESRASKEDLIVLEITFKLKFGEKDQIFKKFEEYDFKRVSKQPLDKKSAGSTFKRPDGYFASKLIDDAGLRGFKLGKAMVSEKHAGFLINVDDATFENMSSLIKEVQKIVLDKYNVKLETEVKIIGEE